MRSMVAHRKEIRDYWHSKVFPSGDFTVGYCPPKRETEKSRREKEFAQKTSKRHYYDEQYYGTTRLKYVDETYQPGSAQWDAAYMALSCPANSHNSKPKKPRGQKGITSYGKKLIRSGCALLQQRYGKKRLSFLTLTMPTLPKYTEEIILTDMGGWAEIVRQLTQELKRELVRGGGSGEIVGCVEIQEERYYKYETVAPHIHVVFEGHKGNYDYYVSKERIKEIWARIVENQLRKIDFEEPVWMERATRIEGIKKNAMNYLGKYMSKGGEIVKKIIEDGKAHLLPTNWYICTNKLRRLVKAYTFTMPLEDKGVVLGKNKEIIEELFFFCHSVERKWKDEEMSFGYCGRYRNWKIQGGELFSVLL